MDCDCMIHELVNQLLIFYPEFDREHMKIEQTEFAENWYEVFIHEEELLTITLNDEGALEDFSVNEEYFPGNQMFAKEVILQKAISLIDTLITVDRESFHLSSMIDFDSFWFIEFAKKDPYLHLELPNSGVSIYINKNGLITSANFETEKIGIEKPEPKISVDDARTLFLENLMLKPIIMKIDDDYIGGDDCYHFVYYVMDNVMVIEMDGTLQTIETYGGTHPIYENILPSKQTYDHLYQAIGIPAHFTKVYEEDELEQWSPGARADFEAGDELEIEYDQQKNVSHIHFITDSEKVTTVENEKTALEKAIAFLTFQFQDAATRFRLVKEDHALLYYEEDEEEASNIYAYHFNFQQFERGIPVATEYLSITVDAESLMITHYQANETHRLDFSELDLTRSFPEGLAKQAYADKLTIEKSWSKEIDEDPIIYKLTYTTAFPETIGAMRAIDAKTGKTWFIDASYMDEF